MHICTDAHAHLCIRRNVAVSFCFEFTDVAGGASVCIDMCMDMCVDMCMDMCTVQWFRLQAVVC